LRLVGVADKHREKLDALVVSEASAARTVARHRRRAAAWLIRE
jgi:hypothetical protein